MSAQSLEEIAELLLAGAKRHGASAADVVVAEGDALDVGVRLGEIEKLKQARQKHLGLRVFMGERSALTSSSDFSRDALERLAEETCALARVTAPDSFSGLPDAAELAAMIPDLDLYDPDVEKITAEQALASAQEAERAALDAYRPVLLDLQKGRCFYCGKSLVGAGHVDHFVPWSRYPDNGLDNLVVADRKCNGFKRSSLAATEHLTRWAKRCAHGSTEYVQLADLAERVAWDRHATRSLSVARAIYLRLPEDARLWLRAREFTAPDPVAIATALTVRSSANS